MRKSTYLGSHIEYVVECSRGELFVINHHVESPTPQGTSVKITLTERGVNFVRSELQWNLGEKCRQIVSLGFYAS